MLLVFVLVGFGKLVKQRLLSGLLEALRESSVNEILELYGVDGIRLTVAKPGGLKEEDRAVFSHVDGGIIIEGVDVSKKDDLVGVRERLGSSKFSIVYIATPNHTHAGYIDFFIEKANRVFVEKPLCNSLGEIVALESKYPSTLLNKVRMVDHYLYKPPIKELIFNFQRYYELVGEIEEVQFKILTSEPYEESRQWVYLSGVIRDLFPHALSLVIKLNELYPNIIGFEEYKILSVKKALYDMLDVGYKLKYDEGSVKETYANIKMKINGFELKAELGVGVDATEKKVLIEGEKGKIHIDLMENYITLKSNGSRRLFEWTKNDGEYKHIMKEILTGERLIGLSFEQAKKEMEIIESLDKYNSMKRYKIGTKPKSFLGL